MPNIIIFMRNLNSISSSFADCSRFSFWRNEFPSAVGVKQENWHRPGKPQKYRAQMWTGRWQRQRSGEMQGLFFIISQQISNRAEKYIGKDRQIRVREDSPRFPPLYIVSLPRFLPLLRIPAGTYLQERCGWMEWNVITRNTVIIMNFSVAVLASMSQLETEQ